MTRSEIVGRNILKYRTALGMSQVEFADKIGRSQTMVSMYEKGQRLPSTEIIAKIASVLGITFGEVYYGRDENRHGEEEYDWYEEAFNQRNGFPSNKYGEPSVTARKKRLPSNAYPISSLYRQRVPMLGEVAAGEPVYAPEDAEVYVDSPVKCDAAITIRGDSMVPNYLDGDVVYIRCRPDVDDGQVAVVFLDDEAAIKHVYHEPNGLLLLSDNPQYPPIRATVEDYPGLRIFGVPVGFTRMFTADVAGKVRKGVSK